MYSLDDDYYSNCMGTYYCHLSEVEAPEEVDAKIAYECSWPLLGRAVACCET